MVESAKLRMDFSALAADELVRVCTGTGDATAWEEFVRRFHPVIAAAVLKTARQWNETSPDVIDELIQDTYLRLCANRYQALRDFDPRHPDAVFGFLKTVAFSVVQDHFRASFAGKRSPGRQEKLREEVHSQIASGSGGVSDIERGVLLREIDEHLRTASLPEARERDRWIFWLYYRHGLTARAISQIPAIGLSQKGVESTIGRLTRHVRRCMAEGVAAPAGDDSGKVSKGNLEENPFEKEGDRWTDPATRT